ncbi:MAG: diguanylate cyclase [Rubrobacteraceae bacterium]
MESKAVALGAGGSAESLKRRVYVVILLAALAGSVLGLVLNELTGLASPFIRNLLVVAAVFEVVTAWMVHREKLRLAVIEEALYVIPAALLLGVLVYALYLPASPEQAGSALRGFYLWIPAVYIVVFLAHEGSGAFARSCAVYFLVMAVSLPSAAGSVGRLDSLSLDQLYISGAVVISFLYFVARLKDRLRESEVAAERLKQLAETDDLTGLHNRRRSSRLLEEEMERSRRYGLPLSVIVFDIDDFKRINDEFGHDTGDEVLAEVAHLARKALRESDELGRWGGEEFIIVAPETRHASAHRLAERLREAMEEYEFGVNEGVSASFGVSELRSGDSATTLVKRADAALYRAKTRGKNRVEA